MCFHILHLLLQLPNFESRCQIRATKVRYFFLSKIITTIRKKLYFCRRFYGEKSLVDFEREAGESPAQYPLL